jgi:hypothetical protein
VLNSLVQESIMVDEQNEHVVIEHFARVDYALLEPMVGALQDSGISVIVHPSDE